MVEGGKDVGEDERVEGRRSREGKSGKRRIRDRVVRERNVRKYGMEGVIRGREGQIKDVMS